MRVFRSTRAAAACSLERVVATLGVFDGVHRGHQAVLGRVVEHARACGGCPAVVTFGRHPRAVIEGRAPKLITALRHKLTIFESLGIEVVLLLHFDQALRNMSPRRFVERVFVEALRARKVVLGYNNRFGRGGAGDFGLLEQLGLQHGFETERVGEVLLDGEPLSSTAIRAAILDGDLERAARMLGRPCSVLGRVVEGDRLGATLGFPTANLNILHEVRPPRGVWGCEVRFGDERRHGLVNIGVRPTLAETEAAPDGSWAERDRSERVEVHVLDLDRDLYGRLVELVFLVPVRAERRFASLEDLSAAIAADCAWFRGWLQEHSSGVDSIPGPQ